MWCNYVCVCACVRACGVCCVSGRGVCAWVVCEVCVCGVCLVCAESVLCARCCVCGVWRLHGVWRGRVVCMGCGVCSVQCVRDAILSHGCEDTPCQANMTIVFNRHYRVLWAPARARFRSRSCGLCVRWRCPHDRHAVLGEEKRVHCVAARLGPGSHSKDRHHQGQTCQRCGIPRHSVRGWSPPRRTEVQGETCLLPSSPLPVQAAPPSQGLSCQDPPHWGHRWTVLWEPRARGLRFLASGAAKSGRCRGLCQHLRGRAQHLAGACRWVDRSHC